MLLQESNLTNRMANITLHISFNKRRRLAKEGLVNLTRGTGCKLGSPGCELGSPALRTRCYPLL